MQFSRKAKRELMWIFFLVSLGPMGYFLAFGSGGYIELRGYREQMQALQRKNDYYRAAIRDEQEKIDRLRNDPDELERIAREKLQLAKPEDVIILVPKN